MKKKVSVFVVLFVAAGLISFSSCTKIEESTFSKSFKKAKLSGWVQANLDLSNDTNQNGFFEIQWEEVPSGTKIFARINTIDLDQNPSGGVDYQDITFDTSVGSDGTYSIEVYAGPSDTDVTLIGDEFTYQQKINDSTFEWKVFSMQDISLQVINDQVLIENITFFAGN